MGGLSRTNLLYMRAFAETWPDESIVQQVVGQIPWGTMPPTRPGEGLERGFGIQTISEKCILLKKIGVREFSKVKTAGAFL